MIEVKSVYKAFDGREVLIDLNLTVQEGEMVIIMGESGSGKTVLLRLINGLLKPDKGEILIDGIEINKLSERELLKIRKGIGFVFQSDALFDSLNVYENLALYLRIHREDGIRERVGKVLRYVGLSGKEELYPNELSGGMRKRLAIAREIVRNPKYLLLDEPTANLDAENTENIIQLIEKMEREMGKTFVIVTHDPRLVKRLTGLFFLLREGKLWEEGR
uniref:ATP-binding cassette domain-containing protein n=1 Tax=candidate division WOR-3 bacterium TaxID=2052148 RepID=A0A7C3UVJ6_UNCW3